MLHGLGYRVMGSLPYQIGTCSDLFCQPYKSLVYFEICDRGHVIYPLYYTYFVSIYVLVLSANKYQPIFLILVHVSKTMNPVGRE